MINFVRFFRLRPAALLVGMLAAAAARANPPLALIPTGTFNVTTFGAKGDGQTDNTAAIQNAIKAATAAGGGTVTFPPPPLPYLSGALTLTSKINLEIQSGAILRALPYGTYRGSTDFITISSANNVEISGTGNIDGNGGSGWWTGGTGGAAVAARPFLIRFNNCNTVEVLGILLTNSPEEHLVFGGTSGVTINSVDISAPATSPNTDGIDPAGSNYLITNCVIATGDDNIAIKPESTFCSDITITGCTFGSGHGLSVGGETNQGLNGLYVTNCTFNGTQYGIRLKAYRANGGLVQNCNYSALTMTGVQFPIWICSYYNVDNPPNTDPTRNPPVPDAAQTFGAKLTPQWSNITISSVISTNTNSGSYTGLIWGVPESLVNGVTLTDVNLSANFGMIVNYATGIVFAGTNALAVTSGANFSNPMATTTGGVTIPNLFNATLTNAPP